MSTSRRDETSPAASISACRLMPANARSAVSWGSGTPPSYGGSGGERPAREDRGRDELAAELLEPHHPPALVASEPGELGVRVDDDRVADRAQHRQVRNRVRVGPRLAEIEVVILREPAHALELALAV